MTERSSPSREGFLRLRRRPRVPDISGDALRACGQRSDVYTLLYSLRRTFIPGPFISSYSIAYSVYSAVYESPEMSGTRLQIVFKFIGITCCKTQIKTTVLTVRALRVGSV